MSRSAPCLSIRPAVAMLRRHLRWGSTLLLLLTCELAWSSANPDEDAKLIPASAALSSQTATRYLSSPGTDGQSRITASFLTFDNKPLTLGFALAPGASRASLEEFGISAAELDTLLRDCMAAGDCEQAAYDRQTTRYYREHALRLRPVPGQQLHLFVDVAQVVQRNRDRVLPVANALRRAAAERGYDRQWMIAAAVAFVQTGLVYRKPAGREDGRDIFGFYPPPRALERGYGDCDTKAALLAAILQNLTDARLIGVHVPQHYLLGIAGTPQADQASLRYDGGTFVLVEAAGPGKRPPGDIASTTQAALARSDEVRIDPLF